MTATVPSLSTTGTVPSSVTANSTAIAYSNEITITGPVMIQRRSSGFGDNRKTTEATVFDGRNRNNADIKQLRIQVQELDGDVYPLELEIPKGDSTRQALIDELKEGDRITVSGKMRWQAGFDRRFRSEEYPDGRQTRELCVLVHQIARAADSEVDGSYAVLTGQVSRVPAVRPHEVQASNEMIRGNLLVRSVQVHHVPGRRPLESSSTDLVAIDVPMALTNAGAAGNKDNVITVVGRLEPFRKPLRPETNDFVRDHRDRVKREFANVAPTLSPNEQRRREKGLNKHLESIRFEQAIRIRAQHVELHEGSIADLDELRHAAAEQRRDRQRTMRNRDADRARATESHGATEGRAANRSVRGPVDRTSGTDIGALLTAEALGDTESVDIRDLAKPARHRKHIREDGTAADDAPDSTRAGGESNATPTARMIEEVTQEEMMERGDAGSGAGGNT